MSNISLKQILPTSVPTPAANYVRVFSNLADGGALYTKDSSGNSDIIGSSSDPVVNPVTYVQLYSLYSSAQFVTGSYYLITDFETKYRQPDYYVDGNLKTSLSLKGRPSGWSYQPILVQAISNSALAVDAYQPNITGGAYSGFHKDKIKYDLHWSFTEFNDPARGRITKRIDEYGNETDYDHRTVLFKRYMNYSKTTSLTGTIAQYDCVTGAVSGSGTLFSTELSTGDIIILDSKSSLGYDIGFKVSSIASNTSMNVVVDSLYSGGIPSPVSLLNSTTISANDYNFTSSSFTFWKATSTGDYNQYKEVYFGQSDANDYDEFYTFSTNSFNNKIADYAFNYLESHPNFLILPNNVFITTAISNSFLSITNNNTIETSNENLVTGPFDGNSINQLSGNVISAAFRDNVLGLVLQNTFSLPFYNNTIVSTSYIRYNNFKTEVNDVDFTGTTNVSGNYNCEIFKNSSGVVKLSYYNGSNVLTIDDVNS